MGKEQKSLVTNWSNSVSKLDKFNNLICGKVQRQAWQSFVFCNLCKLLFPSLLSQKNNATRTMMPVDCWFKTLVILEPSYKGQSMIIFSALINYTSKQRKITKFKGSLTNYSIDQSNSVFMYERQRYLQCWWQHFQQFPRGQGITTTFNSTKKPWNCEQQWNTCSCWECRIKESCNTARWGLDLTNKFEISIKTIAYVFSI